MLRRLLWLMVAAISSAVMAQDCVRTSAFGDGAAQGDRGPAGEFHFAVKKEQCGDRVSMDGRFEFVQLNIDNHTSLRIVMTKLVSLKGEGNTATFSGRAILETRNPRGSNRMEGKLDVNVWDRRVGAHGDPDRIALRFGSDTTNFVFEFGGNVKRGDIKVIVERIVGMHECGTYGEGTASRTNNLPPGTFRFKVVKRTMGDRSNVEGRFNFRIADAHEHVVTEIAMRAAHEMLCEAHSAGFSGAAALVTSGPGGRQRVEGVVTVKVADLRRDNTGNARDHISIHFKANNSNRTFDFDGVVTAGDIVVYLK